MKSVQISKSKMNSLCTVQKAYNFQYSEYDINRIKVKKMLLVQIGMSNLGMSRVIPFVVGMTVEKDPASRTATPEIAF